MAAVENRFVTNNRNFAIQSNSEKKKEPEPGIKVIRNDIPISCAAQVLFELADGKVFGYFFFSWLSSEL